MSRFDYRVLEREKLVRSCNKCPNGRYLLPNGSPLYCEILGNKKLTGDGVIPAECPLSSPLDRVPKGFEPVEAFTDGKTVIVLGEPPDEDENSDEPAHSCDAMGCGSMDHVIARFLHPFAPAPSPDAKAEGG